MLLAGMGPHKDREKTMDFWCYAASPVPNLVIDNIHQDVLVSSALTQVNSFRSKLQHCRSLLDNISGVEMSCEEQKELLRKCQAQYREKWWVITLIFPILSVFF